MDEEFLHIYFKRLEERRENVRHSLLSGESSTFEEYKYKAGLYEGIGVAVEVFKEYIKKEDEDDGY